MNTAVDTSVLLAIFNGETGAQDWLGASDRGYLRKWFPNLSLLSVE